MVLTMHAEVNKQLVKQFDEKVRARGTSIGLAGPGSLDMEKVR
jgi:hypothetical protein